jgi:hypothetical protein
MIKEIELKVVNMGRSDADKLRLTLEADPNTVDSYHRVFSTENMTLAQEGNRYWIIHIPRLAPKGVIVIEPDVKPMNYTVTYKIFATYNQGDAKAEFDVIRRGNHTIINHNQYLYIIDSISDSVLTILLVSAIVVLVMIYFKYTKNKWKEQQQKIVTRLTTQIEEAKNPKLAKDQKEVRLQDLRNEIILQALQFGSIDKHNYELLLDMTRK